MEKVEEGGGANLHAVLVCGWFSWFKSGLTIQRHGFDCRRKREMNVLKRQPAVMCASEMVAVTRKTGPGEFQQKLAKWTVGDKFYRQRRVGLDLCRGGIADMLDEGCWIWGCERGRGTGRQLVNVVQESKECLWDRRGF